MRMLPFPLVVALAIVSQLAQAAPPNVLIVFADDMGYSDIGCYGGEIETPNIDALAAGGLRFTQFYNTARCWPSRAALMTGYYAQQVRRDTVPGTVGSKGRRPAWAPLLPAMLKPLGYRCYHTGKWHIDGQPMQNGFDHSYDLEDHDHNFGPKRHFEDGVALPAVDPQSGFYTTTAMADHAIKCLREHAEKHAGQPFLSYLAFTVPHFPLQAPAEDIARYRERYRRGWEVTRAERWARLQKAGLVAGELSAVEREVGPPYHFPEALQKLGPHEVNRPLPWSDLTEAQRAFQMDKMAIYAAMVDRMDRETGRVLEQIRQMGAFENTIVFFCSDNGSSAEMMVRGDGHDPHAAHGSASSYLSLGPGWSTVANTPFRRHKTWTHEGGIATPLVVHWPKGIAAKGELRTAPSHLIDLVPTIFELAGAPVPKLAGAPPLPGRSLVPTFAKDAAVPRETLWWMHEGHRALRVGDWKITGLKDGRWELYDLAKDRAESRDLAAEKPEKLRELADLWEKQWAQIQDDAKAESAAARR